MFAMWDVFTQLTHLQPIAGHYVGRFKPPRRITARLIAAHRLRTCRRRQLVLRAWITHGPCLAGMSQRQQSPDIAPMPAIW